MKINKELLKNIFSEHINSFIGGVFTLAIGLLSFYLTPLKDNFYHFLYREKAEVKILIPENVYLGDNLKLDNILIKPKSKISIAEGTCEIIYDNTFLTLSSGNNTFKFPTVEGADLLLDNSGINFKTIKSGKTSIKTIITTKYNTYKDSIQVSIKPPYKSDKPSSSNFSGLWKFKLGFHNGEMNLHEISGNLSGTYNFDNGETGNITGFRDATPFHIDLVRKGEIFKWRINALWKPNGDYIEINGEAEELIIMENDWKRNGARAHTFYSSVKTKK
ncbi:hypothetical protein ACFFU1_08225 [Algibacter miyuki]|uniref:FecR protein domain-containing protein n=1 Tax=Algibacter miyuki TaxID=1306933 RepID=A0ABV5GZ09_9FLAO|nr:hypothetical protein [Algibacter miyuki]MDN3666920.1 hypothetical protein [Algibacter miyuki]